MSSETKAAGAISKRHIQTPNAQCRLISSEDFRDTMRAIRGILNKGKITAVTKAIFSSILLK